MRPAARFSLAALGAVLLLVGGFWWASAPVSTVPPRERPDLLPLRPEGLDPVAVPIVGNPTDAEQAELLDRLEAVEAEKLGASEAARRRRVRERKISTRVRARVQAIEAIEAKSKEAEASTD